MSIRDMVSRNIERRWWADVERDPKKRQVIRDAARAVVCAPSDTEEFKAIVRLRKEFPS